MTDSIEPSGYAKGRRRRDEELSKGGGKLAPPSFFWIDAAGGKQKVNRANTEGIFRIIQSLPSPRAEPFKCRLARVGYERVQEIEDPELATKRARALYKAKGYSGYWIEKRMRGIAIRAELAEEWKNKDVGAERGHAILTAEISKATFGLAPSECKNLKRLERENRRDHMTDLELIFSMPGEAAATEITSENYLAILRKSKKKELPK